MRSLQLLLFIWLLGVCGDSGEQNQYEKQRNYRHYLHYSPYFHRQLPGVSGTVPAVSQLALCHQLNFQHYFKATREEMKQTQ